MKATVQYGQSLFDLALQYYGGVEGVFLLCKDNPNLVSNWHDDPVAGTTIYIKSPPISAENKAISDYYATNAITPASIYPAYSGEGLTTEFGLSLLTESGVVIEIDELATLLLENGNILITENNNNITLEL